MKKLFTIFCAVVFATTLYSENITRGQLVVRNGIVYKMGSDRPFTGTHLDFYKNGQLTEKNNYKNGKFHGPREGYLQNGQLEWFENYKNGQLIERNNYKNGKFHGHREG